MRILLVNPPIYDFAAYDFWLQPYGLFRVAGRLPKFCRLSYFNFLVARRRDPWGRGPFDCTYVSKPSVLRDIPRRFRRYGKPREDFRQYLAAEKPFDAALIPATMTYWYPGITEVIEDIRCIQPSAKIVLGGTYCTICPQHALTLGADLVINGCFLDPLWSFLSIEPENNIPIQPPGKHDFSIIKISDGCPFNCSYCYSPIFGPEYTVRPAEECVKEILQIVDRGIRNVAFYDDSLLYRAENALIPFLKSALGMKLPVSFHTPNALNARFISSEIAQLMVRSGFASFFIGLESSSSSWQKSTGGKVDTEEYDSAVRRLKEAGAKAITTYIIIGHPLSDDQDLDSSIRLAHDSGTKILLSEFSPIPGTEDGEKSRRWADLEEPLAHNKTAFAIRRLGYDRLNRWKQMVKTLNSRLPDPERWTPTD